MGLGDETCKIFLSTKGKNEKDVPEELIHFLKYMEESTEECVAELADDSIARLHEKVRELKNWRELEARYMTGEELLRWRELQGRRKSILELLEDCGTVPEELREKIVRQWDEELLKKWLKYAAKASSVEEFLAQI